MSEANRKSINLDKNVFKFFKSLISEDADVRNKGATDLISYLTKDGGKADKGKEHAYALKRLVRGVGSDTEESRAGFFTALVGYLKQIKDAEYCPSITEIFTLVKSELSPSDGEKKVKMDIRIGKVAVCGAIIDAEFISRATDAELQLVIQGLKQGLHKLIAPITFHYLSELVQQISSKKFANLFWPIFEGVVSVPKEEQTKDTLHLLLAVSGANKKIINAEFYENIFGCPHLLHVKNYEFIANLLWKVTLSEVNHPFYDFLIAQLIKHNKLAQFWTHGVDAVLSNEECQYKLKDIIALKMFISIMNHLEDFSPLPQILSAPFLELIMENVKTFGQLSEDVQSLYKDALEELNLCYSKITNDDLKLEIFEKLVSAPSSILIEKHTGCKIIQNLLAAMDADTVKQSAEKLKKLVVDSENKGLLNSERIYAAHTLQKLLSNRNTQAEDDWHLEIVKFFLNLGIFYSSDGMNIIKGTKQQPALSTKLVPTMKSLFFHCLEQKHAKLADHKRYLMIIVDYTQVAFEKYGSKSVRTPFTDEQVKIWNRMLVMIKTKPNRDTKLGTVFNILVMYMGLHLFSDPDLACSSITELISVMKRVEGKKQSKKTAKEQEISAASKDEPQWIEVVVDLLLNLLSQNSHLLRTIIRQVFPHLSSELTLTAFNQILSVINLKDKSNPLSAAEQDENEPKEKMENGNDGDGDEDDDTSGIDSDGDSDDENDSDSDNEQDDELTSEEEDDKVTDKVRMAVQTALGQANPDTDTESVDIDTISESEGRKLDDALAAAFKMYKQSKKSKPTKADERVETTLTHFRMRVFDLIDIYLKNGPSMIICLELMLYIFEMLPVAIKETKLKNILNRYRQIFENLTKIKQFNSDLEDVTAEHLAQILNDLVEKVAKGSSFPEKNQYLLKACQFIVICSQLVEKSAPDSKNNPVNKLFCKYLKSFIADRNPPVTLNIFQMLFRLCWNGNWRLAKTLTANGLAKETRTIRKAQTLQLLKELMKNRRFLLTKKGSASKLVQTVGEKLVEYMDELQTSKSVSQSELCELVQLLVELFIVEKQSCDQPLIAWEDIGVKLQALRQFNFNAQTMGYYTRFCKQHKLNPINNSKKKEKRAKKKKPHLNGTAVTESDNKTNVVEEETEIVTETKTVKRKKSSAAAKQKRLKKEQRLKAASEGLESVSFVNAK